jgi:hypothetical protein
MDVEFGVADTFEELRPSWKRAEGVEEADALLVKLEGQSRATRPRGLAALAVVRGPAGPEGEGDDESDGDEERDAAADARGDSDDECGRIDGEVGEGGDAFDEESAPPVPGLDDQEQEVVLHRKPEVALRTKEDEDLDAEFAKMMQDSRAGGQPRRPLDLHIPLSLVSDGKSAPEVVSRDGEERIVFQLLTKKNMKTTAKSIAVPADSAIASSSLQADDEAAKEQAELKRKVLGYQTETELQKFHGHQERPVPLLPAYTAAGLALRIWSLVQARRGFVLHSTGIQHKPHQGEN